MARAGMSDEEMTAFIKETFCVDSTYKAVDLFAAAELPPSWQTVCTKLGLSTTRGTELQNALLRATRDATGKGGKRKRASDELPTDESGRPLVYGQSVLDGVCRDANGAAPKDRNGMTKAKPPPFDLGSMMRNAPRLKKVKEPPPPLPDFNLEVKRPQAGWAFRNDMKETAADAFKTVRDFLGCAALKPGEQPVEGKPRGSFELTDTHVKFNVPSWRDAELVEHGLNLEAKAKKFFNNHLSYLAAAGKMARSTRDKKAADAEKRGLDAEAASLDTPLAVRAMREKKEAELRQRTEQRLAPLRAELQQLAQTISAKALAGEDIVEMGGLQRNKRVEIQAEEDALHRQLKELGAYYNGLERKRRSETLSGAGRSNSPPANGCSRAPGAKRRERPAPLRQPTEALERAKQRQVPAEAAIVAADEVEAEAAPAEAAPADTAPDDDAPPAAPADTAPTDDAPPAAAPPAAAPADAAPIAPVDAAPANLAPNEGLSPAGAAAPAQPAPATQTADPPTLAQLIAVARAKAAPGPAAA